MSATSEEIESHVISAVISADNEYRPLFHFTPTKNWMNDPNGLIFHDGEYHMFFQYNPFGTKWGHMSWGHAVSKDLLSWQELPIAIPEDEFGMIFSGSAVSHEGDIFAIYTRHSTMKKHQSQCIARSSDNGRSFIKFDMNPVLDLNLADFRDPKVFRYSPTEKWCMVVALPAEHKVALFSSTDLVSWTFDSEFGPAAASDGQWECPDLFPILFEGNEVWVLVVSLSPGGATGGSGTQYFIGDFDGVRFISRYSTSEPRWLDYGRDNYAGVTFNGVHDGRRILIGWMASWQNITNHPSTSWTHSMTIPRELGLTLHHGELTLTQQPVREFSLLQDQHEYSFKVTPGSTGRSGLTGFVEVGYDADAKVIFVDTYTAPYEAVDGEVELRVIVDRASVELRTADGIRWISMAVFPPEGESRQLRPFSRQ